MSKQQTSCPKCGSTDVSKPKYSRRAFAISFLLIGFPLPFLGKTQHCFDCGSDFSAAKDENINASSS